MTANALDIETIVTRGQCVYDLHWDTGEPGGGSGHERVYALDGIFVVIYDDQDDVRTFPALVEAISATEELHTVGPATKSIQSIQLEAKDILPLLRSFDGASEAPLKITINGEHHIICQ